MRKNILLFVITLLTATTICIGQTTDTSKQKSKDAAGSNADQTIVNRSKEVWEAYKNRNVAAIQALTGEDYVSFTQAGPSNLQQDIATIDKLTIESYTLDDAKVSKPAKDVVILRYKCELKGSYDGKPFKPAYATEVWVNRGGKWQIVSYSETPVSQ
jgi:ketosteroid isomerase-like protein